MQGDANNATHSFINSNLILKQKIDQKRRIVRNNLWAAIVMHSLLMLFMFALTLSVNWVIIGDSIEIMNIGLLYQSYRTQETNEQFNSRITYNLQQITGIITFIILFGNTIQQFLMITQQMDFIIRITNDDGLLKGNKKVRFKTYIKTIFYTQIVGILYWTIMTGFHIVFYYKGSTEYYSYAYYAYLLAIVLTFPVHIYFNYYKNRVKQRQVFENLLMQA